MCSPVGMATTGTITAMAVDTVVDVEAALAGVVDAALAVDAALTEAAVSVSEAVTSDPTGQL